MGIRNLYHPTNQYWWSQCLEWKRPSRLSSTRWHMEPNSKSSTCYTNNANLTHADLYTTIDKPENWWNIHLVSYDTLTSRATPLRIGRLSHCSWSFGISDVSHRYRTKNSVGCRIATNARIEFKLQVTATPGFNSLYYCCYQAMWLVSCVREDPENDTVMEMRGVDALYSAVNSLMYPIRTEDHDIQQDPTLRMIQITKPWTIRWWSELKLVNGKPLVRIPNAYAHLVTLEWNEDDQAKLNTHVERSTSWGASAECRVLWWQLVYFSFVLGDPMDQNDVSGQWYDVWPLDTFMYSPIFRWLRDTFLPMLVNEPAEYPEPDEEEASNEALLHNPESYWSILPSAPPPQRPCYFVLCYTKCVIWSGGSQRFCGSFGYILQVCRNGQLWVRRNAAQIPRSTKSVCVCNYTQRGLDTAQSHSSKPCGNNSEVPGIVWAVGRHLHRLSDWGKTEFHTDGYWILDPMVMMTQGVITNSSQEWHKWESWIIWGTDRTSGRWWYTVFWSGIRTIRSGLRSMESLSCQMARGMIIIRAVKSRYTSVYIQPTQFHQLIQNRQIVWRIRHNWGVREYWLEFDSISC